MLYKWGHELSKNAIITRYLLKFGCCYNFNTEQNFSVTFLFYKFWWSLVAVLVKTASCFHELSFQQYILSFKKFSTLFIWISWPKHSKTRRAKLYSYVSVLEEKNIKQNHNKMIKTVTFEIWFRVSTFNFKVTLNQGY